MKSLRRAVNTRELVAAINRVESHGLCAENKVVTDRTFISFRGPQALNDRVESHGLCAENKVVTDRTFISFRGPQALNDRSA
jgi:hypothetical protein